MSRLHPTGIRRSSEPGAAGAIDITWSDGVTFSYAARLLRDACPCASCRERRSASAPTSSLTVLAPQDLVPLTIAGMTPVGQYAYSIEFSDGHSTGIYTLEYLRELGASASNA